MSTQKLANLVAEKGNRLSRNNYKIEFAGLFAMA
jgi:hypothetical protein